MELRHLRYFVAVAEELHFARAAERLYISQPSLSSQISRLEKELGVQLLYRTKRRVELTEVGQVFLEGARRTLQESERTIRETERAASGQIGRLVVGFVGPASLSVLSSALRAFGERYPEVELEFQEMNTTVQLEAIREGSIQVGFLRRTVSDDCNSLEIKDILKEEMIVALPRHHDLSYSKRVQLAPLAGEPLIVVSHHLEPALYETVMCCFHNEGLTPNVVQEAGQLQIILSLVSEGIGVSLLPNSVRNSKRAGVVYRNLQVPTPKIGLSIAWRRNDPSTVLQAFLNTFAQVSHRLPRV